MIRGSANSTGAGPQTYALKAIFIFITHPSGNHAERSQNEGVVPVPKALTAVIFKHFLCFFLRVSVKIIVVAQVSSPRSVATTSRSTTTRCTTAARMRRVSFFTEAATAAKFTVSSVGDVISRLCPGGQYSSPKCGIIIEHWYTR